MEKEVIKFVHDKLAHPSPRGIYLALRNYVQVDRLQSKARRVINNCKKCQEFKNYRTSKYVAKAIKTPEVPFSNIATDIYGPIAGDTFKGIDGGSKIYIITYIDLCTRWAEAFYIRNIGSSSVIKALKKWISKHGSPEYLISDNGRQFASNELKNFLNSYGTKHIFTTAYNPRANGTCERINQTIGRIIRCNEGSSIKDAITRINLSLQHSVNRMTTFSPNELGNKQSIFDPLNREIPVDIPQMTCISDINKKKAIEWHNKKTSKPNIMKGMKVYRKTETNELTNKIWQGPYTVVDADETNQVARVRIRGKEVPLNFRKLRSLEGGGGCGQLPT